jgi:glycosyltransferase involved in cell wall biosynthesis
MNEQDKRKHLLVVTSTFSRWEDDKEPPFVFELCRRFSKYYSVHVVSPHFPGSKTREKLGDLQATRFRYFFSAWESLAYQGGILEKLKQKPIRYGLVPFFVMGELLALVRVLRQWHVDLIHAHWLFPQGMVALLARLFFKSRPPLLCTSHGGDLFGLHGFLFESMKRFILRHSDAITVVSRAMREEVLRYVTGHAQLHVIPMGVDLQNRFVPLQTRPEDGSLLFVGRLVEKKGLRYLIQALPLILRQYPDIKLRIAGDGPEKTALRRQVMELKIDEQVQFLGPVENDALPHLYQTSEVVIFPSVIADDGDREGFGLVLVEALGCECAVVATDLPAMQDIVTDGKTGLIVPQKNVEVLAEKVVNLLNNRSLARSLGERGREYVLERYNWDLIVRKYVSLIESICG